MSENRIRLVRPDLSAKLGFDIKGGKDRPYKQAKFDPDGIYVSRIADKYVIIIKIYSIFEYSETLIF